MSALAAVLLEPQMRRRVVEIRQGEEIVLTGVSVHSVRFRLIEKSGKKARVVVEAPDDVKIDTSGLSAY
jgi:hypothetical protein